MDGFGRTIKVEMGDATSTQSVVDTEYDSCACSPIGKMKRVSQPYAPGGTVYWTTYTYDGLGRTVSVNYANNTGTTAYSYLGNQVTVTDPAGKWKTFTSDAFGNLTQVTEPDPQGGANQQTYYTYDILSHLTQVQMTRGSVTQYRSWVYDVTTQRLTSVTHPESGTTRFDYDSEGRLWHKDNANNTSLTYSYDAYHRVTQIADSVAPSCETQNFYYDRNNLDWPDQQTNTWGRLHKVVWGGQYCASNVNQVIEHYGYNPAGQMTYKGIALGEPGYPAPTGPNDGWAVGAYYFYNNEGQMTSIAAQYWTDNYSYDTMGRLRGMSGGPSTVSGATYNAAGQITYGIYNGTQEWWQYNERNQLSGHIVAGQMSMGYQYSATQNNGQIQARWNYVSGEIVTYTYDSLNRLIAASTNNGTWGLSFSYDGFGNRTAQTLTAGSGPPNQTLAFDASNHVAGHTYDANGNTLNAPGLLWNASYDASNRLLAANNTDTYGYGADNRRVYKNGQVYLYTPGGQLLAVWLIIPVGSRITYSLSKGYHYFGSREVSRIEDQLGTVQYSGAQYYPYGEEYNVPNEQVKFATYWRDSGTGLDYAHNRYYASSTGRFVTADPYAGSAIPTNPQSWNRYLYTIGDPVNGNDPSGLADENPDYCDTHPNSPACKDPDDPSHKGPACAGPCQDTTTPGGGGVTVAPGLRGAQGAMSVIGKGDFTKNSD
jgi:RHS repeat-associated protein